MKEAYTQGLQSEEEDDDGVGDQIKPRDVGHNIYILAHQVREEKAEITFITAIIVIFFLDAKMATCWCDEVHGRCILLKISSGVQGVNLWLTCRCLLH